MKSSGLQRHSLELPHARQWMASESYARVDNGQSISRHFDTIKEGFVATSI
jgi:hypothetical protein